MRRSAFFSTFWAIVLIVAGILLVLGNMGILQVNVWGIIWPLMLLGAGAWILWNAVRPRPAPEVRNVVIPLEGAGQARLHIRHAGGRLRVGAGSAPDLLVSGTFGGGLDYQARREGDALVIEMNVPKQAVDRALPWNWGPGGVFDWNCDLSRDVPLALRFDTGGGEARLDLTDLRVSSVELKTGASSTTILLPAAAGHTRVAIEGGATAVSLRVPAGVAARIQTNTGLAGVAVDQTRFPRVGDAYESADFATAPNRVEVTAQLGVGSLDVR